MKICKNDHEDFSECFKYIKENIGQDSPNECLKAIRAFFEKLHKKKLPISRRGYRRFVSKGYDKFSSIYKKL